MKTKAFYLQRWAINLVATLMMSFSSFATADLLDDLKEIGDLIKHTVDKPPANRPAPVSTPTKSQQSNSKQAQITSRDLETKFSRPEYYYERPSLFNSLGFELGEYITIEPLDSNTFHTLYVPSYKGLPLLALTPSYLQIKKDINIKNAVKNRFNNDMLIYHNLRLLEIMAPHITAENLKVDTSNQASFKAKNPKDLYVVQDKTRPSDRYPYKYVPRFHIESLTTTLLPEVHQQYFHDPAGIYSSSLFKRAYRNWGGYDENNEFKSRRAYFSFIDTELAKLKTWAKTLSSESYIAGTVTLGEYDFKRQGFEVAPFAPRGPYQQFFYAPRDETKQIFEQGNGKGQRFFFAIDEAKAETLLSQTKTSPNGQIPQLYFVVKGEVYDASPIGADRRPHNQTYVGVHLAYDVTGPTIEFFSDELLTNKVHEVTIAH